MNKTVKQMLMRAPLMIGAGVFGAVLVNVINGKPISLKLIFFATIFMIVMTAIGLSVGYLLIGRTKDKKVVLRRQKKLTIFVVAMFALLAVGNTVQIILKLRAGVPISRFYIFSTVMYSLLVISFILHAKKLKALKKK